MPKLLHYSEKLGCGMTVRLDSGEPCTISVAQAGVLVKQSRFGFLGATLYNERNVYQAATTGMALDRQYPNNLLPVLVDNPVLRAFANAVWHCQTAAEVARVLNEAFAKDHG